MTRDDSISSDQRNPTKARSAATGSGTPTTASDEQPMTKPSVLWFLVPILLIALGIFFAR